MTQLIRFTQHFGGLMLDHIWLPLFIWTIVAIPIVTVLYQQDRIPPVYQYHARVALLLALPVGIIGSYLTSVLNGLSQSAEALTTKFIVLQNPIAVTSATSQPTINNVSADPMFWIGLSGILIAAGSIYLLFRMLYGIFNLQKLEQQLTFLPISAIGFVNKNDEQPLIAFSDKIRIPFTYGWFKTRIVIPSDLQDDSEALAMAVQHELMHIKHRDFLLNGILISVKALFWIHPLTHYLYNSSQEYREITCDGEVLANNRFSKKRYAELLFKLAEREHQTALAMSMAVNPSSLKKRIQIMSDQSTFTDKFRTSFILTMISASLIVLTMACTDMADNGITNSEVHQAQAQMRQDDTASQSDQRVFYVNGQKVTSKDEIQKLSRIKTKYIKSIHVSKVKEKHVIRMTLWNKNKAYSDLNDQPGTPLEAPDYFVSVKKMPELKGGLKGLQQKINYPEKAQKAGIEGRVIIRFIVNKQGEVENPQVIRGIGDGCDKEALRVIKQAKFKPGRQNGKAVRVQYAIPITYRLPAKKGTEK